MRSYLSGMRWSRLLVHIMVCPIAGGVQKRVVQYLNFSMYLLSTVRM